ncbi:MAG: usg protein [Alphaproteobacteria bacterium]
MLIKHGLASLVIRDYRLTTAEILYHLPDYPRLLQTFVWQDYDAAPDYPVLRGFLEFWKRSIEGRLHSVRVATAPIFSRRETRFAAQELTLH